jgi:hypothetical protein
MMTRHFAAEFGSGVGSTLAGSRHEALSKIRSLITRYHPPSAAVSIDNRRY